MYSAIISSVRLPLLHTKYPRAHRCRPPNSLFSRQYSDSRWWDRLPLHGLHQSARRHRWGRRYVLADGSSIMMDTTVGQLEFEGKIVGGTIVFGDAHAEPLLGATALESGGFEVDPRTQKLKRLPAILLKVRFAAAKRPGRKSSRLLVMLALLPCTTMLRRHEVVAVDLVHGRAADQRHRAPHLLGQQLDGVVDSSATATASRCTSPWRGACAPSSRRR